MASDEDRRRDIEWLKQRYEYGHEAGLVVVREHIPKVFKELGVTQNTVVEAMGGKPARGGTPGDWRNRIAGAGEPLPSGKIRRGLSFAEAWGLIFAFELDAGVFDPDLPGY